MTATHVTIDDRQLKLSNLDKVLYPKTGFAKRDVIEYYRAISDAILPHLRDRPLTLKRYPDGVEGQFFYEKRCPKHKPEWVETAPVWSPGNKGILNFCLANDLPTLIWAANLASLELHVSLGTYHGMDEVRRGEERTPTTIAFDLDPGPPATIVECSQVALWLRDLFAGWGLKAFPKTSGSKGMQVYVPLNTPDVNYDDTKPFAHALAKLLEKQHPELVVSRMSKELRTGKVFVDWSQNDDSKTTVCVYSLRAKERPTASTPLLWDEVAACAESGDPEDLAFEAGTVVERFHEHGDLFAEVLTLEQQLPELG